MGLEDKASFADQSHDVTETKGNFPGTTMLLKNEEQCSQSHDIIENNTG
jgi:hypothetical protein